MRVKGGGFGDFWVMRVGALRNGISALMKEVLGPPGPFHLVRTQEVGSLPPERPWPEPSLADTLVSDTPASSMVPNALLWFISHPVCGGSLW